MTSHEYEFTYDDHRIFSGLYSAMRFVGVVQLVAAFLISASALITLFDGRIRFYDIMIFGVNSLVFVMLGVMGVLTMRTAASIQKVMMDEGLAIIHLMLGMNRLSQIYSLQRLIIIIIMLIGAGAFVLGM